MLLTSCYSDGLESKPFDLLGTQEDGSGGMRNKFLVLTLTDRDTLCGNASLLVFQSTAIGSCNCA